MSISARNNMKRPALSARRWLGLGLALSTAILVTGCEVGPDFAPPVAPAATHYTSGEDPANTVAADGVTQHFSTAAAVPSDWWRLFNSPKLDAAVLQGLAGSPTIALAEANLRQARDSLRAGQGVFYPQIDGAAGASRQRPSHSASPANLSEGTYNLFTLSASVSYTLDIFGGEQRAVEVLEATANYQQNVARAASLTLISNIANAVIANAAYDAEIKATEEIIGFERQQVRLASAQSTAGTMPYADMLVLESQLEASEALLPPLRQKLVLGEDLLSVLMGRLPSEAQLPKIEFAELSLPRAMPLSIPSALVRQRPDILQAEASLHAASAGIGVATAAMLPNLSLTGAFGSSSTTGAGMFTPSSVLWSLGAGVVQPIFHGGTLWYQREAAKDAFDASAASYRQIVLVAFGQVADTLRALEHDAEALAAEDRAVRTASHALLLMQANYTAGLATYVSLLLADIQYHDARIAEIGARATRYQDSVALFAALGGGWWNDAGPPEPAKSPSIF